MRAPELYCGGVLTFTLIGCILGAMIMAGLALIALLWVIDYILNSWQGV